MYTVEIDREKCEGCGECAEACPGSVLGMVDGKAEIVGSLDDCLGCESCTSVCPSGAVNLQEA